VTEKICNVHDGGKKGFRMQKNSQICDEIRYVCHIILKFMIEFTPEETMTIQRGRRGIALLFF
jgi:hypothetical protein